MSTASCIATSSPTNILVIENRDPRRSSSTISHIKLSDFGLARHVVESESLMVTRPTPWWATPAYMAPSRGPAARSIARTDVLRDGRPRCFHLLAGRPPSSPPA